jgi:cell division protein FtsA
MSSKKFQTIFDCGLSKIRAGTFNKENHDEAFYIEGNFFSDSSSLKLEIHKIIISLEKDTHEYINNIDLMVDSPNMLSIGISVSKKN